MQVQEQNRQRKRKLDFEKKDEPENENAFEIDSHSTGSSDDLFSSPSKRRKLVVTPTKRALEWFYDLVDSPDNNCVAWVGDLGHFIINDVDALVNEFRKMRGKPNYNIRTITHNFFRPYNFAEINGVKKIQNGNIYISLDIETGKEGEPERSVFRPGNRSKLSYVMHRGTGLPVRRFFVNGTLTTQVPQHDSQPKPREKPQDTAVETKLDAIVGGVMLPETHQAVAQGNLTPQELKALDSFLAATASTWLQFRANHTEPAIVSDDKSVTEGEDDATSV